MWAREEEEEPGVWLAGRRDNAPSPWLGKLCAFWFGLGLPRSLGAAACEATQDGGRKKLRGTKHQRELKKKV